MKARYLRFPGGEKSDNYIWTTVSSTNGALVNTNTTIPSPLTPRVADVSQWPGNGAYASASTGRPNGPHLDFDEFMTQCQTVGGVPVIVVAYDQAREITGLSSSPTMADLIASAAAWVKYANITKGYGIRRWSIGNESWFRSGQTASKYAGHVKQFSTAMRAIDPTIQIGAHGNSTTWFTTVITNASAAIDWLDVHDYPTYDWGAGYDVFRLNNKTLTTDTDKAIASINAASSADQARLKIGITETNAIDWKEGKWPNVNDLGHALVTFDMIGQQLSKPKVEFTQIWNTRWVNNVSFNAGSGSNPVLNPGFENGLASWVAADSGTATTTSVAFSGAKALQGNGGSFIHQNIPLGSGLTRTLKGYARTDNTAVYSGIGIDFLNRSGTKISGVAKQITGTTYSAYTLPFTTPAGTTTVQVWLYVDPTATAYLDDVSISDRVEPEVYDAFAPDNSFLPIGRALALWGQFLRDDLVQGSRSASVIAYASRSSSNQTMTVWLLNKQTAPVDVNLVLSNYSPGTSASAWRFAGNGPSDFAPTYVALPAISVPGSTIPITLPKTSVTVLVFSGNQSYRIVQKGSSALELALASDLENNGNATAEAAGTARSDDHLWMKVDAGAGWFKLTNKKSGRLLNVSGANLREDGNIAQWASGSDDQYLFREVPDGDHVLLQVKHSLGYVDSIGSSDGTNIQHTLVITDKARWSRIDEAGWTIYQQKGTGLELSLASDDQNNANVTAELPSSSEDHQWIIESSGEEGWFHLRNSASGQYFNVSGGNMDEDANIAQWPAAGGDHYKVRTVQDGDHVLLQFKHSGKYLRTIGVSNGTNVSQSAIVTDRSRWSLIAQ